VVQKQPGFLEVRGRQSFGEQAIGRRKEIPGPLPLAALSPQSREVARRTQRQRGGRLISGHRERLIEVGYGHIDRVG
jgi:hypothetical protein